MLENIDDLPNLLDQSLIELDNFGMGRINVMFTMGKEDVYDPETQVQVRLLCGGPLPISPMEVMLGQNDEVFKRKSKFACGVGKKR